MNCQDIIKTLSTHKPELQSLSVRSLWIFGSAARGQATEHSDVDMLIEFERQIGLFHFTRVRRRLSEILGCEVDLVTRQALREEMREQILQEAIHAA